MVLQIKFSDKEESALREVAKRRGVPLEELARRELIKLTQEEDVDDATFRAAAKASLQENDELLKRLA